jgi:ABC-2 type transport system ATP-binding protein
LASRDRVAPGDSAGGLDPDVRRRIGLAPQEPAIFEDLTAWENLQFFGGLYGLRGTELERACGEALELSGLEEQKRTLPRTFSGGLKRRLNIACALVHRPELLILDEPTTGIDPQSRNRILEQVRNLNARGTTVIYTSHYLAEVQSLCTSVGIMDRGRVVAQGTIDDLTRQLDSEERIRLVLDRPSPGATERLLALEGVLHCGWEEGTLVLSAEPGQVRLARVVEAAADAGVEVIQAERVRPGLEDLFLAFTGRRLPIEGED